MATAAVLLASHGVMTEIITFENVLRMLLGIGVTLVVYTIGVGIGSAIRAVRLWLWPEPESGDDLPPYTPPAPLA
jgi:hypothetical protein